MKTTMSMRMIAAVCAALICAGTFCTAAFADTGAETDNTGTDAGNATSTAASSSEDMETAIKLVKSRVEIPEEFSKFSYTSSKNNGMQKYNFTWTRPTGGNSYSVTISGDIITSYRAPYAYSYSGTPSFGKYTAAGYESLALQWIYKVNPEMKGCLKRDGNVNMSITGDSVSITFKRVYNDVAVANNTVRVSLSKKTGEVLSMSADWWQGASFVSPDKALSQEQIKEVYTGDVELKAWYRLSYDNKTQKYTAAAVYSPVSNSFEYDAVTGKPSSRADDYRKAQNTDLYAENPATGYAAEADEAASAEVDMGVALDGEGSLTEEEAASAEELKSMLTSAQFKELIIKDPYIDLTDDYLTTNFSITKNKDAESGYMIDAYFSKNTKDVSGWFSVKADAKSGKVYSFSGYNSKESESALDPSKAVKLADSAAKYYYGDIFSGYRADPDNSSPATKSKNYSETSRTMRYYRYENGIQVDGDYINITVNSAGSVTRANSKHTKDVDFGDGKIISADAALNSLYEQQDMELSYRGFTDLESVPYTYLTYTMPSWNINAKTGKLCSYSGGEISETDETAQVCPYTDISSSPYKAEIKMLYDYGVRIYGGDTLSPNALITDREFEDLMNALSGYGATPLYYGNDADAAQGSSDNSGKYVTRAEFAKKFVNKIGGEEYAKLSGIYKSPFTDVSDNSSDIGYIAIAYAMGAIDGTNGVFSPNEYVTREYAMHCLYRYVITQSS